MLKINFLRANKKTCDRSTITVGLLNGYKFNVAVDVGSRDGKLLQCINAQKKYSIDYHADAEKMVGDVILHNLENGLPGLLRELECDLIVANDVIEHVENKNLLTKQIFEYSKSDVVISLPNTQHMYYVRGLCFGSMGKQFNFDVDDGADRHRWVTYYKKNIEYMSRVAREHGYTLVSYKEHKIFLGLFSYLLLIIPKCKRFLVFNQIFHFRRCNTVSGVY